MERQADDGHQRPTNQNNDASFDSIALGDHSERCAGIGEVSMSDDDDIEINRIRRRVKRRQPSADAMTTTTATTNTFEMRLREQ